MKFECVSSDGTGFKWGKIYEGARVNNDSFVVVDEHGSNVNMHCILPRNFPAVWR
ncbi:hypothetical protein vBSsoS008_012 [Shigella phage vB_SsoS_008]|nr:hypothetical protein vBSsoS008_012 [Shigella phage vB_SsoS_008]